MKRSNHHLAPLAALALSLAAVAPAWAQTIDACPRLPGDSTLTWTERSSDSFVICRAVTEDGREVFGLYLAGDSPFQPRRANREEAGVINGQDIRWYRSEVAGDPDKLVRETLLELDRDRVVHIWLHADSEDEMRQSMGMVEALRFEETRFSSN
ncbi:hypothetical protein QFW77_14150 [Luteimonas sp. RD2P54]|uniref:Uncharacterized protein n=1 Tax=Luteimonas endophytica TaxID=3042023 RepID=A0ABT6JBI2_9GAMM|nr:hypothetical protein [Luteimonas endophytica]MDH5824119.1 hypothetical protein [Luteimonas endophytica]